MHANAQIHIIEQESEVEFRAGLFYVTDRLESGMVLIRVFRPNTLFRQAVGLAGASRDYRVAEPAEVIPFPNEERRA